MIDFNGNELKTGKGDVIALNNSTKTTFLSDSKVLR
jgi:hypothetical protein